MAPGFPSYMVGTRDPESASFLSFFVFLILIYLKGRVMGWLVLAGDREIFQLLINSPNVHSSQCQEAKARSQDLPLVLPRGCKGPSIRAFPRCFLEVGAGLKLEQMGL